MMGLYATQNLTWTPSTIFEECRKEIDAKFPHGWMGLQKHCCLELVRKARREMGLGNTIATVENTPAYSHMTGDTTRPFLHFSGNWPHPSPSTPDERMRLMIFGNPELIPLMKNPGQLLFFYVLTHARFLFYFWLCDSQDWICSWMLRSPVRRTLFPSVSSS